MTATCSVFLFAGIPHSTTILLLWVFVAVVTIALLAMLYYQVRKHKRLTFEIGQLSGMKRHTVEHEMVLKAMKLVTWRLDANTRQIVYDSDFRDAPDSYVPQPGITIEEFVKQFSAHDAPIVQKKLIDLCEGRTEEYHEQHQVKASHGDRMYWTESFATIAERDAEGKPSVIVGTAMRIDERKKLETELISSRIKAEESDRLKSAFLDNISHEIRTPLNAIVGFSGVLQFAEDDEERAHLVNLIQENNDKLLKIFEDVVNMSSIEAGDAEIEKTAFDVDAVIRELIEEAKDDLNDRPIDLSYVCEKSPLVITSDPDRVKGIINHFLDNAIKFTDKGSIVVRCEFQPNNILRISVKDTGKGIAEEDLERIFDRFVKLDVFVQGVGLGLPVCRSFANAIGGNVGVESVVGKGSTFWLDLPDNILK